MSQVSYPLRQQVEGFAELVSASGKARTGNPLGNDFRGPSVGAWTREWWLPPDGTEADVVWRTAQAPQGMDTTFSFIGESADLPENLYPPNQAKLYVNGGYALTFDLGLRAPKEWQEGDFALQFTPRQVHTTADGYHRQFRAGGCSGIYQLAVPGTRLKAGEAVTLRVVLEPRRSEAITWFAVRQRSDVLEVSPRTNAEQIAQLQDELIHLKRIVGNLARRCYADLLGERIEAEEVLVYTHGLAHVHPPDVLLLHNGDLLVAFREASEHLSLDGTLVTVRSHDGGKTWGERQVLLETPHTDEREINLNQLADGTLLFSGYPDDWYDGAGRYTAPYRDPTYRGRPPGIYVGRSTDNGRTWTIPPETIDPAPFNWLNVAERMVELPGGRLLMPVYGSYREGAQEMLSAVYVSDDKGYRWRYLATVGHIAGMNLDEPALLRTRSGRLIMMMRNDSGRDGLFQSVSDDDGQTWTAPVETPVPGLGVPCSLLELPSGTILCIYGLRRDPAGIHVVASHDDGATWDVARRRVLRDDFPNMDCGYPSSVLMPDGRIFTVYYFNMFGRFFIAGSFFRWPG